MEEESSPFDEVPAYVLYEIAHHIPCKVDRVRALVVNCSWRTSLQALPPPPLPPQLPWLLRPSAGGPTFSFLLSGADELSVHRVRVPADLRGGSTSDRTTAAGSSSLLDKLSATCSSTSTPSNASSSPTLSPSRGDQMTSP
uniref:F-box domain-containing protein n=1 Tax=Oryza nivara TaxID=4536 RepID=A0A0E0HIN5_ORYNI